MKLIPIVLIALVLSCSKNKGGTVSNPTMSWDDVTIAEGNGGTNNIQIKLKLSHAINKQVSVVYNLNEGTAKAGPDFATQSNQLVTFAANETEKTITVAVVADDIKEADEVLYVRIDNPINVLLTKGTCNVTLTNDDTKIGYNNTGYDAPTSYPGLALAWGEEFNNAPLDAASWTAETGDGCPGLCGWGNNELEYYTAPPNNLFFQDGKMIIEARAETFGGKNYTSARIKTAGKKTFKFGRVDIRAILPKGKGVWPAFWLLPQSSVYGPWPKSGEIDLMELIGNEPNRVYGTAHYGPGPGSTSISRNYTLSSGTFNDAFHVFSIEWTNNQIKWLIDNTLFSTVTSTDVSPLTYPFNESFYFLVNLAIGGNWPGAPDASTTFPQWLIVDYIRVYQ